MIFSTPRLRALEAAFQREAFAGLSYEDALARFASLWAEARAFRPDLGADWEGDLAPDLAVARAVNGLPPAACLFRFHREAEPRARGTGAAVHVDRWAGGTAAWPRSRRSRIPNVSDQVLR